MMYESDDGFENYSEVDDSNQEQSAFQVTDSNESTAFQVDDNTVEEDNFMTVEATDFDEENSFNVEESDESTEETFEITEEMKNSFEVTETDDEDDEKAPFDSLVQYMSEHNYGREDYETYSQDPEWRALQKSAYPDFELPELSEEIASDNMTKYMSENNYGMEDYDTYSKDPQWQQMYRDLYHEEPEVSEGEKKLETPDKDYEMMDPNEIQNVDSEDENFWNHHGNQKEDYIALASKLPEVQARVEAGESLEDIMKDEKLKECAYAYYERMVTVEKTEQGCEFQSDGRHRIEAAKELGYKIPVKIVDLTEKRERK